MTKDLDGLSVSYKGLDITLPFEYPYLNLANPVEVYKSHIIVKEKTLDFVFPRNRPLHYRNAITRAAGTPGFKLAHTHVFSKESYAGQRTWGILDFISNKIVPLGVLTTATPVAVYDGLVWWLTWDGRHIVPSLVDTLQPFLYIRRDRIMNLPITVKGKLHQVDTLGNTRFLSTKVANVMYLLDLKSLTVTELFSAFENDGPLCKFLPGYIDDVFRVWCMSQETMHKYSESQKDTVLKMTKEVMQKRKEG